MRIITFILLLFVSTSLLAQNAMIEGKVVDKRNHGLSNVLVYLQEDSLNYNTYSNLDGEYNMSIPSNTQFTLILYTESESFSYNINAADNEILRIDKVKFNFLDLDGVDITTSKKENIDNLDPIEYSKLPTPSGSIESFITFATPASSNNELSNNYNVRGGNYNENLVYVNGIQIYRPFLTRSGQQEGMSFINPNFVENLAFSAGGFTSNYGDRLSSVLDITYRTPEAFHGSLNASILGAGFHIEDKVNNRFNYMVGARYRSNGYLLNALPTTGAYNPVNYDVQLISNYNITENLVWTVLGHFSSNSYNFAPETQNTTFGTINEAYSFRVYFDGQERTRFRTITGASSLNWHVNKRTDLRFTANVFNTNESENFTIQGQYFINQLETDPADEDLGDSIATLGVGTYLDHARNQLNARIYSANIDGSYQIKKLVNNGFFDEYEDKGKISWGVKGQIEEFDDRLSEWHLIDSAGYSIPQAPSDEIQLFEVIKANNNLTSFRVNGYAKFSQVFDLPKEKHLAKIKIRKKDKEGNRSKEIYFDTIENSNARFKFDAGVRAGYTDFNKEFYITPRATVSYIPRVYYYNDSVKRRFVRYHFSTGLYYQPPFYRELRSFDGSVNTDIKSQKSVHFVAGMDYQFEMWERDTPFKMSSEIYYKYMWDVNPYEVDNVRIRYYTTNRAVAFAYGLDVNINGEFIPGMQSFVKLGLLHTAENLLDDSYEEYVNANGENIYSNTDDKVITDTITRKPGFIPRPSDQWVNVGVLFQDRMPKYQKLTAQLGLNYGYKLPYGPPDFERYKDVLRQRAYFRVDLGFGYDFLFGKTKDERKGLAAKLEAMNLTFEIWNLLGIKNVLSQQWVQDVSGNYYAIPNYLTQRRFNLKFNIRF